MDTAIAVIKIDHYFAVYDPFLAGFPVNAAKFTGL